MTPHLTWVECNNFGVSCKRLFRSGLQTWPSWRRTPKVSSTDACTRGQSPMQLEPGTAQGLAFRLFSMVAMKLRLSGSVMLL